MDQPREMTRDGAALAIDGISVSIALDRERLQDTLDRRCADEGLASRWDARVVATTASTNSDLLDEARSGRTFSRPAVLAAEIQTEGRGRLGRRWQSALGASLTASYALRVARRLAELEGITLVCGLAVRDALARHGLRVDLKWPNDVLVDGRKLAGI
ncbi:MAG: biotin--[acetyl-CoA-carboxylase] ligase, partial [Burkholderiaceae bacterium]